MGAVSNIGAGKTELVLSTVYWICGRLVVGDPDELDSSRIFQSKFGEKTISEALAILQRNLIRVVDPSEDDEKYALSLSILNFLKGATRSPVTQKFLEGKNQIFRQIMLSEDTCSSDRVRRVPIDLENSHIGRQMSCMMETLSG